MCMSSKPFWDILPKTIWSLSPQKNAWKPAQQQPYRNMHPSQYQKALNMYPSQCQKAINVCQGYFCKWFNIPPHNEMYNKQTQSFTWWLKIPSATSIAVFREMTQKPMYLLISSSTSSAFSAICIDMS